MKKNITGNEAVVLGALKAGAKMMTGYPITPTTEIIQYWSEQTSTNDKLKFIQTEDEMSAGFAMIGAILAGVKCFSATAGPGNVLMQDAFSMAENMRIPTVAFINQRGGPSTGTVIYSQQELNLTCYGGNGEGLRIVYSTANPQEMYDYAIKAFNSAWKYRFPTFALADGYQAKTKTQVEIYDPQERQIDTIPETAYLLSSSKKPGTYAHIRNTYNFEDDLADLLWKHKQYFDEITPEVVEFDDYHTLDAEILVFAHGIVAAAAKIAIDSLRHEGKKVGMFRPITLSPFPRQSALNVTPNKKRILIIESSLGQFERLVKSNLYPLSIPIDSFLKPAQAFTPEEIIAKINDLLIHERST